eukprot:scaffold102177_cov43-Phaeocystis_antarctica.AAC.2
MMLRPAASSSPAAVMPWPWLGSPASVSRIVVASAGDGRSTTAHSLSCTRRVGATALSTRRAAFRVLSPSFCTWFGLGLGLGLGSLGEGWA